MSEPRRYGPRSFRGTIVVSTVGTMALTVLALVLGVQLLLARTAERDIRTVLDDRASAVVNLVQQASTRALVVRPDALEPGTAVFDGDGALVAGSLQHEVRALALRLADGGRRRTAAGPGDRERLLGTPFATPAGDRGFVVVSQETDPYERSERYALVATVALGLFVVCTTAFIALRVTRKALDPVTQMAQRAADWSEHDLTHRFAMGPPTDELAALGGTLDQLLDRVASAILSEQRLTAELAHELRTPLTSIQGSAGLALMRGVEDSEDREDFEAIAAAAHEMSAVITTLLEVARASLDRAHEQSCTVAEVVAGLVSPVDGGMAVEDRTGGSTAHVAAPRDLVVRAVAPLVDNALRHARARVLLTAADHADHVELVVADDGAGVDPSLRDRVFEPGASGGSDGAGLGLGIARRVARSFGGDVRLDPDATGAVFVVTLPRR